MGALPRQPVITLQRKDGISHLSEQNGDFYCDCGGFHENGPCRLICLNTWSPVGVTVWEGLGGVALLEEACYWDELRDLKSSATPVSSSVLLLSCESGCKLSATDPASCLPS